LLHGYAHAGVRFLDQMNGQFSFAIWDESRQQLFCARDRLGIRPFYYYFDGHQLIFASEIKAIFATGLVKPEIDPQALCQVFTFWTTLCPRTIFKNIYQLPPGHYLIYQQGQIQIQPYWRLTFPRAHEYTDYPLAHWMTELKQLLIDAALIRLRADVPVGAYLSGGLDSSIITAIIKKYTHNPLKTFSVSFEDRDFDESRFQQMMVQHLATEHRDQPISNDAIFKYLPQATWHTEIPILRTAPIPMMLLAELVHRNNFKVVLTGEGADEFLGGYNIFKENLIRRFWAKFPDSKYRPLLLQKIYPYLKAASNRNRQFLIQFFGQHLTETENPMYSHLIRWLNTANLQTFFSADLKAELAGYDPLAEYRATLPPEIQHWAPMSQAQYIETNIFLSGYLLSSQGDRMAMAHSVEGRFPFLDYRVVELTSQVPPQYKIRFLEEKYLLKKAMGDLLPDLIARRPKQPYRAPISNCFYKHRQEGYLSELLSTATIRQANYFEPSMVTRFLTKWEREQGQLLSERENMALVGLLSTMLIHQFFIQPGDRLHSTQAYPEIQWYRI
ncbi:asparagine synthase (glutamine-hydrolyzing), partial [candidate division KSB1 bacterium]|nr:asparagine synthase (glutamine-hydrolyzing) [candidate division KSB1 bacterium]